MAPYTFTPAVGVVCRCKSKAGLRRSPRGLHTRNTINITAEIEAGFVAKDDLVPFLCSPVSSCVAPLRTKASILKGLSIYDWMAADEAVGCRRAFLTMWRSSRRLVCQGRPEPGLRVHDISRIHCSQHLLTTQSERSN
ncbi:uncharacterized protein TNCV_1621351 [Trichonephila clavipes]|nr:uncharacterized protein TNCV_1621351 [Trichonephila clavipes]